ncbi:hypothetical protein DDQ41_03715 [Streptomyces spongiicola]|uniref:ABC transporter permease n=1 Tax=Streptomyces spongiicola TaxID=1690221 RepID=A0ABN5KBY8_9ACTN|nr:hypothetical protein [Streptomyces spongiicola]AWK08189.1 hypothetical protein DDQ41_03715 [Streptomyces spongiicola]
MSAHDKPTGRLQGGLSRLRDHLHLARFLRSHRKGLSRIGWALLEGLIGAAVGLTAAALWIANR